MGVERHKRLFVYLVMHRIAIRDSLARGSEGQVVVIESSAHDVGSGIDICPAESRPGPKPLVVEYEWLFLSGESLAQETLTAYLGAKEKSSLI